MKKITIVAVMLSAVVVFLFDRAMEIDKQNLCNSGEMYGKACQ